MRFSSIWGKGMQTITKIASSDWSSDVCSSDLLNDIIQKLYEKYVPLATREYIDDRVSRVEEARNTGRRQSRAAARGEEE